MLKDFSLRWREVEATRKNQVLPLLLLSSPGCLDLFLCLCSRYSLMVTDVSIVRQISDSHFVFFHQHHPITSKSNTQVSLQLFFRVHTYQTGKSLRLHAIFSLALLSPSDYLCIRSTLQPQLCGAVVFVFLFAENKGCSIVLLRWCDENIRLR